MMDDDQYNVSGTDGGDSGGGSGGSATEDGGASVVIVNTLKIYGTTFLVLFFAFCIARNHFPMVYGPRSWMKSMYTSLAEERHGCFGWIRFVRGVTDVQLMNECGMDALCYLRIIKFGIRISLFGSILSLCLMPIYRSAPNDKVMDPLNALTISNVPNGSRRFLATVLSCYLLYGFVIYNFFKEFQWFLLFRNRFLTKALPRNYTVFIRYLPEEYRSEKRLLELYQGIYSEDEVLEARVNISVPRLKKKVAERCKVLGKLEKAIALRDVEGDEPTHTTALIGGDRVNSIDEYNKELDELNEVISGLIDQVVERDRPSCAPPKNNVPLTSYGSISEGDQNGDAIDMGPPGGDSTAQHIRDYLATPAHAVGAFAQVAKDTIIAGEEGKTHGSGFVTFTKLQCVYSTLQSIQHDDPLAMEVIEAPETDDVIWENMGISHEQIEYGKIVSFALTTLLMLTWTTITSSIQLLSSVEGLRNVPTVGKYLEEFFSKIPWAETAMKQLAPLLLVLANILLKIILRLLSLMEGPISGSVVQSKLCVKLYIFAITQTFFVSAISGSLVEVLDQFIDHPRSILGLLAVSLPSKSTFFIQYALVNCFLKMGLEALRVVPIAMGWTRKIFGLEPEVVEQERGTPHWNLRAFADASYFDHGEFYSYLILFFVIFLVYAPIAPIVTFFLGGCFFLMDLIYRHQFVYTYPARPDSGGRLFLTFWKFFPYCLLIGQLTMIGFLGIIKNAATAASLLTPLTILTIYFIYYVNQLHYKRAEFMSAIDCALMDAENSDMDFDFARRKYVQPELRNKVVRPYHEENVRNIDPVAP